MKKLVGKQKPFVEYYLQIFNATESARLAGYKGNATTLAAVGYENLRKPHIKAEIERRMEEMTISPNEVLMRLAQHATGSVTDFIDETGKILWHKVKEGGHLIKKIAHTKGKQSTIELHDAQAALVHLGRHYSLFKDRIQIEDWRKEIVTLGLSPSDVFEEMVSYFMEKIPEDESG